VYYLPSDPGLSRGPGVGQGEYDLASVAAAHGKRRGAPEGNVRKGVSGHAEHHTRGVSRGSADGYVAGVDLHTWMLNDLASVRAKLCDGVLARVPPEQWSTRSDGGSSIAHLALHLTRHQDLAVNTAVRDHAPVFLRHRDALGWASMPAGALLEEHDDASAPSAAPAAITAYVDEVFEATGAWLDGLGSLVLDTVPDTPRRLRDLAGLDDELGWLTAMWTDKPVWWFLQWPVIGHGHTHVGEATAVRNRLGFSPFAPKERPA
jgi:hypothetical protein